MLIYICGMCLWGCSTLKITHIIHFLNWVYHNKYVLAGYCLSNYSWVVPSTMCILIWYRTASTFIYFHLPGIENHLRSSQNTQPCFASLKYYTYPLKNYTFTYTQNNKICLILRRMNAHSSMEIVFNLKPHLD